MIRPRHTTCTNNAILHEYQLHLEAIMENERGSQVSHSRKSLTSFDHVACLATSIQKYEFNYKPTNC